MVDRIGLDQSNFFGRQKNYFFNKISFIFLQNYFQKLSHYFFSKRKCKKKLDVEKAGIIRPKIALKKLGQFFAFKGLKIICVCLRVGLIDAFD